MPQLSIIIVNWRSADYLQACLRSVYEWTKGITFEVIVVDNASEDGCGQMLAAEFPGVQFIASEENLGFARANNLGSDRAQAPMLLFLNPDTEIRSDVFTDMVQALGTHPALGAAGARLLNTDGSLQESCVQAFPTITNQLLDADLLRRRFPSSKLWGMQALYKNSSAMEEVDAISGACFLATRQAFEKAGRFTEDYFMYSDDMDLSYKIWHAGYKIAYLGGCEVIHHGGKSSGRQSGQFAAVLQRESMEQFFRATRGPFYSLMYRVSMAVAALARISVALLMYAAALVARQRSAARSALSKWSAVLAWSFGLQSSARFAGGRTHA